MHIHKLYKLIILQSHFEKSLRGQCWTVGRTVVQQSNISARLHKSMFHTYQQVDYLLGTELHAELNPVANL